MILSCLVFIFILVILKILGSGDLCQVQKKGKGCGARKRHEEDKVRLGKRLVQVEVEREGSAVKKR